MTACPTSIDVPKFIRQISTGNLNGSAKTIFDQNILGGMCARVCPTETLCEQACVREVAEGQPVKIGYCSATPPMAQCAMNRQFYQRAAPRLGGKSVPDAGAGPAGLACAHRLAMYGHDVVVLTHSQRLAVSTNMALPPINRLVILPRPRSITSNIGGIEIRKQQALGATVTLDALCADYDAVFLGIGLGGVNRLGLADEDATGVVDATRYIAELRQAADLASLPVGRRVLVIGGGMTAIDIAAQTKPTLVPRR